MSFNGICSKVALSLCSVYGDTLESNIPVCYSRNADSNGKLIFNPSTLFLHIIVFLSVAFMIYQTNFKQWGPSRKQMLLIMSLYLVSTVFDLFLLGHIIPVTNAAYKVFVGFQIGVWNALFWSILVLGMMPLFNIEDLRIMSYITTSVIGFVVSVICILTAFSAGPFKSQSPAIVFVFFVVTNIIFVTLTLISQIYVVLAKTSDKYLLGILGFGITFFAISLIMLVTSSGICTQNGNHYVDGIFFSTVFNLLSVMMIYKYWDSLNQQEVEFVRDDDDIQKKKSEYFAGGQTGSSSFANSQEPLMRK
eukprot:NODE_515_length_7357_cov_0.487875.p3 type:complete len:306 gc:universal NODE_515_length_7357_cov_0.487875:1037-120(-)